MRKKPLYLFAIFLAECPFTGTASASENAKDVKDGPDPETTTPNGCTCNSVCGATIDDGFKLDWCTVSLS